MESSTLQKAAFASFALGAVLFLSGPLITTSMSPLMSAAAAFSLLGTILIALAIRLAIAPGPIPASMKVALILLGVSRGIVIFADGLGIVPMHVLLATTVGATGLLFGAIAPNVQRAGQKNEEPATAL